MPNGLQSYGNNMYMCHIFIDSNSLITSVGFYFAVFLIEVAKNTCWVGWDGEWAGGRHHF